MEENKKINTQIVIMVVIVIILILSLLGILLYVVNENKGLLTSKNTSTTTFTTSTTTTALSIIQDDETIISNVIEEYLTSLKDDNKISDYQYEVSLLTEEDYCPGMEYAPDKIYTNVKIIYKKIDETFTMTSNDDNTNTESEDIFETNAIYIISLKEDKYQIENFYTGC